MNDEMFDEYKVDNNSLKSSFNKACEDKDFEKFVKKLKQPNDILMKYTSSLEDAYLECTNCIKCKGKEYCKNNMPGYAYTPKSENKMITFSYVACKHEEEERKNNAFQKNLKIYDMPKDIAKATFKNIYKDDKARIPIIKYFKEFIDNYNNEEKPKGLYLTGSFGSGKTYLIASLFNEMAKKGVRSALIYYPDFLTTLQASMHSEDYGERFNYIKKVPLLLLDDIGAEKCSSWSRDSILGPILQYRMESHLPTFFTSNLSLDELETSLSITSTGIDKVKARRIIERIKQLTITQELISKNRRN